MPCSFLLDFLVVPGELGLLAWAEIARGRVSSGVSKHVAQRPQKPQGLLGTGRRGSVMKRVCVPDVIVVSRQLFLRARVVGFVAGLLLGQRASLLRLYFIPSFFTFT